MGTGITKTGCFVCKIGAMIVNGEIHLVHEYDLNYANQRKEEINKEIDGNQS